MLLLLSVVLLVAVQDGNSRFQSERCVDYHYRPPGKCTPPSVCQSANSHFQHSGSLPSYCQKSANGQVCCSKRSTPNGPFRYERDPDDDRRLSERKCAEYDGCATPISIDSEDEEILDSEDEKIILGKEFPHMAAIGYLNATNDYEFHCGGSLISPRFVLTAGHCTKSTNKLLKDPVPKIVKLGAHYLDPIESDFAGPIDVSIKAIHKHPKYDPPSKYHDIALIELNKDLKFNEDIRPACLWTKPDFPGLTEAVATGWGVVDPNNPTKYSNELMKVSLTLLQNGLCNRLEGLQQMKNRNWQGFTGGQLCAGDLSEKRDTCRGDSGAPLQVEKGGSCNFHVIGVTSFGKYCAKPGMPGVYTRVSSYLDWIESIVWPGEQ